MKSVTGEDSASTMEKPEDVETNLKLDPARLTLASESDLCWEATVEGARHWGCSFSDFQKLIAI